jgi:hypothetical protein
VRFIRNIDIENIAEQRLAEYERKTLKTIKPPVPLEKVLAQVYGLTVLWDEIDELPGETVLGGLKTDKRLIVLNQSRINLFKEKPGLERSTLGHEAGHWEFDVDKGSLDYPKLFERPDLESGQRPSGTGEVEVFAGTGCAPKFLDGLRRRDTADQERIANRFAAALSMPSKLVREAGEDFDFMRWRDLYKMAEAFEVNISALTVRLQQLGFIYIDGNKQFHRSIAEAQGQQQLF